MNKKIGTRNQKCNLFVLNALIRKIIDTNDNKAE